MLFRVGLSPSLHRLAIALTAVFGSSSSRGSTVTFSAFSCPSLLGFLSALLLAFSNVALVKGVFELLPVECEGAEDPLDLPA